MIDSENSRQEPDQETNVNTPQEKKKEAKQYRRPKPRRPDNILTKMYKLLASSYADGVFSVQQAFKHSREARQSGIRVEGQTATQAAASGPGIHTVQAKADTDRQQSDPPGEGQNQPKTVQTGLITAGAVSLAGIVIVIVVFAGSDARRNDKAVSLDTLPSAQAVYDRLHVPSDEAKLPATIKTTTSNGSESHDMASHSLSLPVRQTPGNRIEVPSTPQIHRPLQIGPPIENASHPLVLRAHKPLAMPAAVAITHPYAARSLVVRTEKPIHTAHIVVQRTTPALPKHRKRNEISALSATASHHRAGQDDLAPTGRIDPGYDKSADRLLDQLP